MIYVFDTGPLINILNHYYTDIFKSFWDNFLTLIENKEVLSVREVKKELENGNYTKEQIDLFSNNLTLLNKKTKYL